MLGCNGFTDEDGFLHCGSVANPILDLTEIDAGAYERVITFLENACNLFDAPMYNYNKCCNTLSMLHRDFGIISQEMLLNIQKFLKMHRQCGVYLVLILKEDYENE